MLESFELSRQQALRFTAQFSEPRGQPCVYRLFFNIPVQHELHLPLELPYAGLFPGGLVAKTPRSQGRGPRFDPWSGN